MFVDAPKFSENIVGWNLSMITRIDNAHPALTASSTTTTDTVAPAMTPASLPILPPTTAPTRNPTLDGETFAPSAASMTQPSTQPPTPPPSATSITGQDVSRGVAATKQTVLVTIPGNLADLDGAAQTALKTDLKAQVVALSPIIDAEIERVDLHAGSIIATVVFVDSVDVVRAGSVSVAVNAAIAEASFKVFVDGAEVTLVLSTSTASITESNTFSAEATTKSSLLARCARITPSIVTAFAAAATTVVAAL